MKTFLRHREWSNRIFLYRFKTGSRNVIENSWDRIPYYVQYLLGVLGISSGAAITYYYSCLETTATGRKRFINISEEMETRLGILEAQKLKVQNFLKHKLM